MLEIEYKIEFFTFWHCGSGLARGADVDLLVVRDKDGLPFVPGKTIKGLLREAALDLAELSLENDDLVLNAFGHPADAAENIPSVPGKLSFSNAVISNQERNAIIANKAQEYLYQSIASTAIDPMTGTAKEHSLRKMEVAIPCTVYGTVSGVEEFSATIVAKAMSFVKRLGSGRNRGLGRCEFSVIRTKGGQL